MFEAMKTTGMEQNENSHNLSVTHTVRLVTLSGFLILKHIFFLLQHKFLEKIIGLTINFCNFRLYEQSSNTLNVIISYYKFSFFIAIFSLNPDRSLEIYQKNASVQLLL